MIWFELIKYIDPSHFLIGLIPIPPIFFYLGQLWPLKYFSGTNLQKFPLIVISLKPCKPRYFTILPIHNMIMSLMCRHRLSKIYFHQHKIFTFMVCQFVTVILLKRVLPPNNSYWINVYRFRGFWYIPNNSYFFQPLQA